MILIITHKEDFTADFVIEKLNTLGIHYFRFNCEDINLYNYSFENNNEFNFTIDGKSNFHSVWFRRTKLPEVNLSTEAENLFILGDYETLFSNIFRLIKTKKWLSNPVHVFDAENKILQLKNAKSIGLNIPDTIIVNNHLALKEFAKKHSQLIIKPIRQGRLKEVDGYKTIFTNKLKEEIISNIENYDLTPSIIQEYINKRYEIRVTIIGEKIFAARVNSQSNTATTIDWRKEKLPFEKYILPEDLETKCIELVKKMNLSFGAIDLIRDINGEYIFLEINPNGQWAWLEMETGLEISEAIINFLTN